MEYLHKLRRAHLAAVPIVHAGVESVLLCRDPDWLRVVPPVRVRRIRVWRHQKVVVVLLVVHEVLHEAVSLWVQTLGMVRRKFDTYALTTGKRRLLEQNQLS